jgi:hypothetical protein
VAYLVKQIENSRVVWFEKSNQWVKLDEPQWFIFLLYEKQTGRKEAAEQFAKAYEVTAEQAAEIVSNIYDSVDKLLDPDFSLPDFTRDAEEVSRIKLKDSRTRHYQFGEKRFSITYGSPSLEAYIHLPFAHLETETAGKKAIHLDVFLTADVLSCACILLRDAVLLPMNRPRSSGCCLWNWHRGCMIKQKKTG